jgi:hypothetical protein
MKKNTAAILSLIFGLLTFSQTASAHIIEVEIYKDGVEYECLKDTDSGKIFNCERD